MIASLLRWLRCPVRYTHETRPHSTYVGMYALGFDHQTALWLADFDCQTVASLSVTATA